MVPPLFFSNAGPETPTGESSASSVSPPSSSSSPRSSRHRDELGSAFVDNFAAVESEEGFTSSNSDSYDSAGEYGRITPFGNPSGIGEFSSGGDEEEGSFSSRVSSRVGSPVPPEAWEGYKPELLSYRAVSRRGSRHPSGTTTPTNAADKEASADYFSHHYQTSALLSKLSGTASSPTKKRKASWWSRRAETKGRRSAHSSSSSGSSSGPLLGHNSSKSSRTKRSCWGVFGSALLRQPWIPTQPLTILFALLLIGCFVATLTTFIVHVLSTDKQPLPWRTFCQEQRPFPHALADSLAPVNVFVGVFSVDAAYERRHLIRSTYARHSKAIDPSTGKPMQNVQVKFILGRPRSNHARRIALEMESFNDVVVLDVKENMNRGKTHAYFKWASENATVPAYYQRTDGVGGVGVGFRKADYVVKADDDAFLVLSELERHLRVSPREKTYWGYLIRNLFMAGEAYALSADLVQYVATYEPLLAFTTGAEDKRVAKWMRMHPSASTINWVTERCWVYDHPKAGTTYSHGFLFPNEVERIRIEGRNGLMEEERIARGGDRSQSFSTVSKWKEEYGVPLGGMTMEEEIEALVEGGGRWHDTEYVEKSVDSVRWDSVVFETDDSRLEESAYTGIPLPSSESTGVKPGVPDSSIQLPSTGRTKFGKDLLRDPTDVDAVRIVKRGDVDGPTMEYHNSVVPPAPDLEESSYSSASPSSTASLNSTTPSASATSDVPLPASSSIADTPPVPSTPENVPTGQIRIPAHNYILPPSIPSRLVSPPTLRYDPSTLSLRQQRMMNRPYGGTVAVHFLKRNEWFMETALAILGREKMWDGGIEAPAYSPSSLYSTSSSDSPNAAQISPFPVWTTSTGLGMIESVDPMWGGARMYGSPVVREDGYISEGRLVEGRREVVINEPTAMNGRLGRGRGPALGYRLEEGQIEKQKPTESTEPPSTPSVPPSVDDSPVLLPVDDSPAPSDVPLDTPTNPTDTPSDSPSVPPFIVQDDTLLTL